MKNKFLLALGLGIGYVLGAKAGRERYNQIAAAASKFWSSPKVQKQVGQVEDFVKDKAPDVADFVADGAKKVVKNVAGSKAAKKSTTSSSAKSSTTAKK